MFMFGLGQLHKYVAARWVWFRGGKRFI
ncbi:hypothetical protein BVIET440_380004 [Burkholderia vietnamiensis]